jgi:DNA-binding NarL/FixJ family response regulator
VTATAREPTAAAPGVVRVVVADDHTRTRSEVRRIFTEAEGFTVCAEATDADGAVEAVRAERPDVCLLDIRMPGSGIAAAARIAREWPDTAVVMLTVSRNDDDLFDALRAGARGYLLKGMAGDRLVDAVRAVLAGEASLPGSLVARLVDEFRDRQHRRVQLPDGAAALLTPREWDVLELMRSGATTAEIADRLFVSPTTVRSHVSTILRKLRVADREAAIELLDPPAPSGPGPAGG